MRFLSAYAAVSGHILSVVRVVVAVDVGVVRPEIGLFGSSLHVWSGGVVRDYYSTIYGFFAIPAVSGGGSKKIKFVLG